MSFNFKEATRIADSATSKKEERKFSRKKVEDSYTTLRKKIKDELEETETTEEAVEVVIEALKDHPAEEVARAAVEVLAEAIDNLTPETKEVKEEIETKEETTEEVTDSKPEWYDKVDAFISEKECSISPIKGGYQIYCPSEEVKTDVLQNLRSAYGLDPIESDEVTMFIADHKDMDKYVSEDLFKKLEEEGEITFDTPEDLASEEDYNVFEVIAEHYFANKGVDTRVVCESDKVTVTKE